MSHARVSQVMVEGGMEISELLTKMKEGCGFNGRKIGIAADILFEMVSDTDCSVILGLAGALIPGGLREAIRILLEKHIVDAVVTTGANVSHDILETFTPSHFHSGNHERSDMVEVYTTLMPLKSFSVFEEKTQSLLENIPREEEMSSRQFLAELGKALNDSNSILNTAYRNNIPIFCPGFVDSMLGMQTWLFSQTSPLKIDVLKDQAELAEIIFNSERIGACFLGGGLPKHFIYQSTQLKEGLNYVVQITLDRPEHGGLSGADVEEAVSWGKTSKTAQKVNVMADVTLAFPLLVASLLTRVDQNTTR